MTLSFVASPFCTKVEYEAYLELPAAEQPAALAKATAVASQPVLTVQEAKTEHVEAKKALAHAENHEALGTMPRRMADAMRRREAQAREQLRLAEAADPAAQQKLAALPLNRAQRRALNSVRTRFSDQGYVLLPAATDAATLAPLAREVDAARHELSKGGYRIWSPAAALPPALRAWAETQGAELVRRALPPGACIRCLGGAALLKRPGEHVGTPFHQDGIYADEAEGARAGGKPVFALWLALSAADAARGGMRFAPSLGFALLPHDRRPRDAAPDGFENFLSADAAARAERHALSVAMQPGDALVIGSRVVHGSHAARDAERVAFSPLYELECDDVIWFEGEAGRA